MVGINVSLLVDIVVLCVELICNYNKLVVILDVCFIGNLEVCLI